MDDTIITIYYLCDEFLKAINHRDDPQLRWSTAEVMTVPLVASTFFGGNLDKTRLFLIEYGYIKKMVSKSRLNRRLHAIRPQLWQGLFALSAEFFKQRHSGAQSYYVVDSLPVAVCDNILKSVAADCIPPKKPTKPFAATSRASDATFTAYGCTWWLQERENQLSLLWRRARRPTLQCSQGVELGFTRKLDHPCRQGLHRL